MWCRPSHIVEVARQEEGVVALWICLQTGETPNLLHGPPGTGTATVALAMVHQLFGTGWRTRVKALNASGDRGARAVRVLSKVCVQPTVSTAREGLMGSKARIRVAILGEAGAAGIDEMPEITLVNQGGAPVPTACFEGELLDSCMKPVASLNILASSPSARIKGWEAFDRLVDEVRG